MQPERDDRGYSVVVGLGKTGLSCARFLAAHGERFVVADSRPNPPCIDELRALDSTVRIDTGPFFDKELFAAARCLVLSPGVPPDAEAIVNARQHGVEVSGDIDIFAHHARAPVVAITGSNGKSTVTTLVGEMAAAAGVAARSGGNLGFPALDLLSSEAALYVLEVSSFQLEVTTRLNAAAAVVLNISADHLDRHATLDRYTKIKQTIYRGDGVMVINADDPRVAAMAEPGRNVVRFTCHAPSTEHDYGIIKADGRAYLACGRERLLATDQIAMPGRHNWANALAALALGEAIGLPCGTMLEVLQRFPGLPHRCQLIATQGGVDWYEDSKGTNVGATLAALAGIQGNKVVLIAGGRGKGQDFTLLATAVAMRARAVVLIGEDAAVIERALGGAAPVVHATDMQEAVACAAVLAHVGDSVLLSPACASFDMFRDYVDRANAFTAAVQGRAA